MPNSSLKHLVKCHTTPVSRVRLEPDAQGSSYIPIGEFDVCTGKTIVETVQLAEDTHEVSVPGIGDGSTGIDVQLYFAEMGLCMVFP